MDIQFELKKCDIPFLSEDEFQSLKDNQIQKIKIEELESILGDRYNKMLFDDMHDKLDINYYSLNGATFNSLSHGEKTVYSFFLHIVHSNKNEYLLFLDEPDNTLHPEWQKKFLNELINIINRLDKKVHIVITTHSPFLLSDLPKENVIFLEKYTKEDEEVIIDRQKIGNCKNVTEETNIETFGANIHTLLSHGFFMRDGLMGEFAKGKIEEIFDYLKNDVQLKTIKEEDVESIIGLIGEEFLREKLLTMYKAKFNIKSKDDEIAELKAEIERLKNDSNSI